ncbi:MAG TPA: branched-chain amino acid ABC transporter permease [Dehalococcoidales bacterium]|nr:MAG: ABC transporter permease [Chloroflexi bacterium RBG_16_60_22]HJX13472.1 branched-chain amino acid ABC transporter permease [Dehalococcoidales bacterium]
MAELLQFTITGISVGMVYALIALGFALIWKSSSVANLALGQIVLVSSWFTYSMLVQAELPLWLAFPLVIVFALFLGWVIERFALRPLIAQPILSLITVTLGIGYFIEGVITFIWPWSVDALPRLFPKEVIHIGQAVVSQEYLWVVVICLVIFVLLTLFFRYHRMGIAMRATADDQLAVQACGIPVTRVFSTSWMFACVVAAIGGILISSISGITHGLVETGLKSFSVVILGGLDSFLGAIVAGPIIGLLESLGGGYLTPFTWAGVKDIIPFVVIIIVMVIKPYGLFGEVRIERI